MEIAGQEADVDCQPLAGDRVGRAEPPDEAREHHHHVHDEHRRYDPTDLHAVRGGGRGDAGYHARQHGGEQALDVEVDHRPPRRVAVEEDLLAGLGIHGPWRVDDAAAAQPRARCRAGRAAPAPVRAPSRTTRRAGHVPSSIPRTVTAPASSETTPAGDLPEQLVAELDDRVDWKRRRALPGQSGDGHVPGEPVGGHLGRTLPSGAGRDCSR